MDRRLEAMVGVSGKLKEMNNTTVVRMLRLFNLCDLGTASTESPSATKVAVAFPSRNPYNPSAALHWVMPLRSLCVPMDLLVITQSHQPLSAQTFATSSAVCLICMRGWPTAQSSSETSQGGDSVSSVVWGLAGGQL